MINDKSGFRNVDYFQNPRMDGDKGSSTQRQLIYQGGRFGVWGIRVRIGREEGMVLSFTCHLVG